MRKQGGTRPVGFVAWFALLAAVVLVVAACGEEKKNDPDAGGSNTSGECGEPTTTDSGLKIEDLECGDGAEAKSGDSVKVHYTGTLEDGTKFDSSLDRGDPFNFQLGGGMVIKGWDEGVVGMKEGGKRKLTIPSDLGYGDQGFPPDIPAGATLIFEIELLEVGGPY